MLVITALVRLRHEGDCKLKVILVYIERSCLRKPKEVEEEEDDEEEKEAEEEMTEERDHGGGTAIIWGFSCRLNQMLTSSYYA